MSVTKEVLNEARFLLSPCRENCQRKEAIWSLELFALWLCASQISLLMQQCKTKVTLFSGKHRSDIGFVGGFLNFLDKGLRFHCAIFKRIHLHI